MHQPLHIHPAIIHKLKIDDRQKRSSEYILLLTIIVSYIIYYFPDQFFICIFYCIDPIGLFVDPKVLFFDRKIMYDPKVLLFVEMTRRSFLTRRSFFWANYFHIYFLVLVISNHLLRSIHLKLVYGRNCYQFPFVFIFLFFFIFFRYIFFCTVNLINDFFRS
jgi:hypothetical protein